MILLPESAVLEISFGLPVQWLDIYRGSKKGGLCTGLKLEVGFGDDEIVAKSCTADLSAVEAVA